MTFTAFLLIFVSVFLHAFWNFLGKKISPSMAFFALMSLVAGLLWAAVLPFAGMDFTAIPVRYWKILLLSGFFQTLYSYGLARSYAHGDISSVYPVVRSIPVLLTALITILFGLGAVPPPVALAGMVLVTAGCFLIPLGSSGGQGLKKAFLNRNSLYMLATASATTGYTITDSTLMGTLKETGTFSFWSCAVFVNFCIQIAQSAGCFLFTATEKKEREALRLLMDKKNLIPTILAGIFSSAAYVLVLAAMPLVTNVSYVQAFRQMSLPIGVLMGIFFLKEKSGKMKTAGIVLIVLGLILTAFR